MPARGGVPTGWGREQTNTGVRDVETQGKRGSGQRCHSTCEGPGPGGSQGAGVERATVRLAGDRAERPGVPEDDADPCRS